MVIDAMLPANAESTVAFCVDPPLKTTASSASGTPAPPGPADE
jgi:hypothetical protein